MSVGRHAGWVFTPATVHAHGKWFAVCRQRPLMVKKPDGNKNVGKKRHQSASPAEYIQPHQESHVFSSVSLANAFSYRKPFSCSSPGSKYRDREEGESE